MEQVNCAVIGIKGAGSGHVDALTKIEEAKLVAVCDIDEEAARSRAEQLGIGYYKNYHDLIKQEGLNVVSICTPHYLHHPMAIAAMEAGINVFVEKPIAITVRDADEMIEVSKNTGMKLGVCHQYRTSPTQRAAKKAIEDGRLGEIMRVLWTSCGMRTQAYYNSGEWRGTWSQEGGGVLINQTVHDCDMIQWLAGDIEEVVAMMDNVAHDIEVEDIAGAAVRFKNNAYGVLQFGLINVPGLHRNEIAGNLGSLVYDSELKLGIPEQPVKEFIATCPEAWGGMKVNWEVVQPVEGESGHIALIRDFINAVIEDRQPAVPGEDGRRALELVNAIILSSVRGKRVSIPVDRDEYDELMAELRAKKGIK